MKKKSTRGGRRKNAGAPIGSNNAKKEIKKEKKFLGVIRMYENDFRSVQKAIEKSEKTNTQFTYDALLKHAGSIIKDK